MSQIESPSTGELLAVLLARDFEDGEKVIIGTNSDIQLAACNLAREMHAPRLWWISGPGGMVNPVAGSPAVDGRLREHRIVGSLDGSAEHDRFHRLENPLLRFRDFVGVAGRPLRQHQHRGRRRPRQTESTWPGHRGHQRALRSGQALLRRADAARPRARLSNASIFFAGPATCRGADSREQAGLPAGGPKLVVSPLGVFDFAPGSKSMRVRSMHPGVDVGSDQEGDRLRAGRRRHPAPPPTCRPMNNCEFCAAASTAAAPCAASFLEFRNCYTP